MSNLISWFFALIRGRTSSPAATPMVNKLLYLIADDAATTITTMNEGGLNKQELVHDGITPNWTPDGKIIFIARRGSPQIWIMNADGSNQHQISKFAWSGGEAIPLMPQQGKNGVIVFHVHSALTPEIRSIQADGSG